MHNQKDPGKRMLRWMLRFTDFEYDFKYKPGRLNIKADILIRYPTDKPSPEEEINSVLPVIRVLVIENQQIRDQKREPKKGVQVGKAGWKDCGNGTRAKRVGHPTEGTSPC